MSLKGFSLQTVEKPVIEKKKKCDLQKTEIN